MSDDRPRYLSYLLRLWQVKSRRGWNWRASLESPITGKRRGFQNIDGLMDFIQEQTRQAMTPDEPTSPAYPESGDTSV
jgi:hypothetical protein